jgi:glycerol-3-phosphate cytidylyltransferase-like family protein
VSHAFRTAEVILGDEEDIFAPLFIYTPDILAFGYDQRVPEEKIKELFPTIEIARVGSYEPEKWKSSLLRAQKEKEAQGL